MSDIPLHHWLSRRRGFLARTFADLSLILDRSYSADAGGMPTSWLHRLDPRVKLVSAVVLIVHAASAHNVRTIASILASALLIAFVGRMPIRPILRLWMTVGVLAAMLAVPATFLTPGGWGLALKLVLRALSSSTVGAVLVLSTPWQHVLKALRRLGFPVVAVVLVGMSYRYIVLFLQSAIELINARRSRTVGRLPIAERQRLAVSSIGVLLDKAFTLGSEVHLAMQARGYRGEITLIDEFAVSRRDVVALTGLAAFEALLLVA